MNIKNILTPKDSWLLGLISFLTFSLIALWGLGFRLNFTPSLPQGIYRLSSEPVKAGDLVTFCLASNNPFSDLAQERGYLGRGYCPSGLKPLLKHLSGLPGDHLEVTPEGLILNGSLLSGTRRPAFDHEGRALPPSLLQSGTIPPGLALVLSQEHFGSFDSRHFGLAPLDKLTKVKPVLTFSY